MPSHDARARKIGDGRGNAGSVPLLLLLLLKRAAFAGVALLVLAAGLGLVLQAGSGPKAEAASEQARNGEAPVRQKMKLGINLFGPATYNRQQVFTNLISQSEWFSSHGGGWAVFPADQLDERGWIVSLKPGQTAPRPLILPPAPYRPTVVRCRYAGKGRIEAGGVASVRERGDQSLLLDLTPTGEEGQAAWIELTRTDAADPVRAIDCREMTRPERERFHPDFLSFVKQFAFIRFLDWQRTNDNAAARWAERTRPDSSSQVGPMGVSIEDMIDLANRTGADPWFLMPYRADQDYIRAFAQLVHRRLDPGRTVYVELGNEIWNDMFDAAQQARREGLAMKLGEGDPGRAQMIRYAQKIQVAMRIWTQVFADRPDRLVRVAASQNANPALADIILGHGDTAAWVDALATAPYIWIDLDGYGSGESDRVFAHMPRAIDDALAFAERNRMVARRYGKRFITYEGGQHLVTKDMALARAIQRDPRMGVVYDSYLNRWNAQMGGELALYASTTPISEYGSWGLLEYGGQPPAEAPKMLAVQQFLKRLH
ncbi:MAG: hypothetical protein QHC40_01595 [Sphingobium sp.]|nr:hypothetical protein [Sphingobium sp.]